VSRRPGASARRWAILVAVTLLCCGPRPGTDDDGVWYTVVAGDTVERIAQRVGVQPADIIELNALEDPDRIQVGQRLFLYGVAGLLERRPTVRRPVRPRTADRPAPGPADGTTPWSWPVTVGVVSSGFGERWGRAHKGLDIAADEGTPVFASQGGEVVFAADSGGGYGQLVIVKHDATWASLYAHLSAILIDEGDVVMQGAAIAEVGSTGRSTGPHLHFEIRRDGEAIDPMPLLPAR